MQELLASGEIAVAILLLTFFEAAALVLYRRATGRGVAIVAFLPNLLAGDFLLLAWAAIAMRQPWQWSALALISSFICHLTDLYCRWSRP